MRMCGTHCNKCGGELRWSTQRTKSGKKHHVGICDPCAKKRTYAWYHALSDEQKLKNVERAKARYRAKPEQYLFRTIKNRKNKRSGKDSSLVYMTFDEFLKEIGGSIPKMCPILGIHLRMPIGYPDANSPSVDRIDNNRPYEKGNIAIISLRANFIKRDGTAAEHRAIADYIDAHKQKEPSAIRGQPRASDCA